MEIKRIQITKATLIFCFWFFCSRCIVHIFPWFKSFKFSVSLLEFVRKGISVSLIKHINFRTEKSPGLWHAIEAVFCLENDVSAPSCRHRGHRYREVGHRFVHLTGSRVNALAELPAHQSNSTELSNEPTHFMSLNSRQRLSPNSLHLWCDQKPPLFLLLIFLSSKENWVTRTIFHQQFLLKVF